MTVNSKRLIDLLAEKTGLDKASVEEQLELFMGQLKSELSKGEAFEVNGLGTFSLEENDIVFRAEKKLSTEVNHKYAGMKPIELIGAYKETSDMAAESTTDKGSDTVTVPGVEEYSEEMDTPVEAGKEEKKIAPEQHERKEKEPEVEKEEPQVPVNDQAKKEPNKAETPKKPIRKEQKQAAAATAEPSPAKVAKAKKSASSTQKQKKKTTDPLGKLLVAAVIVIAIGISGWMFYDLGYFGGSTDGENGNRVSQSRVGETFNTVPAQQGNSGEQGNKTVVDSVTNNEMSAMDNTSEQEDTNSTSSITSIAEASRQSPYGLRGGASPDVKDGYTIVVHSLRDEAKVRRLNEELMQSGYRTVISRASIMDTTFWRLGLGRFKTIEDAQDASLTLPSPYKSNHFIKRIQ